MKPTLIIVDDVKAVRERLAEGLREDFEILGTYAGADEAIEACRVYRPALVIMDLVMPHRSGIEATKAIMEEVPETRVIVFSGLLDENVVLQALDAGASEYLSKPIDMEKLKEVLKDYARPVAA